MAILGLGTDIVEIARIDKALARTGDAFARRILAEAEYKDFKQHKQQAKFLAKRFAVKEAASKALGTGIACGVSFYDFSVAHDELGKPLLIIEGKALEMLSAKGMTSAFLTISDEHHYCVATVLFES